ncbi:hypothetical protein JCM30237_28710 [Halolamina litorea]|jgi:hypothetical protein|uniref:Ion transporter n=1 Tax=Halolamina litorea TaxID=1515593 RepID=A0ABD6BTU1_9EURY|nr:hypothetical protein [Halolamina litorea]
MDAERWWSPFVGVATAVWIALFAVDLAVTFDVLALAPPTVDAVRRALRGLLAVFLIDLALLYRWSEQRPLVFLRENWFLVLTAVPWFRPLRLLRAGRSVRALRLLARSRRVGALLTKLRRTARVLWQRLRE